LSAANSSAKPGSYIFGPVPSRRLGLSLGVDIVPFKVCPLDCVYCQLGRTTTKTTERRDYVPVEAVLAELKQRLDEGVEADYISLSGSGEPTLHSGIDKLISGIKRLTSVPVALLTNGVLFNDADVRRQCLGADLVMPSLDAGDDETFKRINRPHNDISIENVISGLAAFRDEFKKQIWLEVFIVEGLNTGPEQIAGIKAGIERIRPDKVQLNTAVRPTADINIERVDYEKLQAIAGQLGDNCEIVAGFKHAARGEHIEANAEEILTMLRRRPCSLDDICSSLGFHRNEALKYLGELEKQGRIELLERDDIIFFKVR
jgi:wyosine [tRNA(Phe)-imidazoG37] synthetase (radical SAM superfamily)